VAEYDLASINIFNEADKVFSSTQLYYENIRKPQTSWKLVSWIIRFSSLQSNSKLVSAAIGSFYNVKNGYAHPSYDAISKRTGLGLTTIYKAVSEMKLSGEWIVIPITGQNLWKKNNRYIPLHPAVKTTGGMSADHVNENGLWMSSHRENFYVDNIHKKLIPITQSTEIITFKNNKETIKNNLDSYHSWVRRNRKLWNNWAGN
jgi:hypothetical protein